MPSATQADGLRKAWWLRFCLDRWKACVFMYQLSVKKNKCVRLLSNLTEVLCKKGTGFLLLDLGLPLLSPIRKVDKFHNTVLKTRNVSCYTFENALFWVTVQTLANLCHVITGRGSIAETYSSNLQKKEISRITKENPPLHRHLKAVIHLCELREKE